MPNSVVRYATPPAVVGQFVKLVSTGRLFAVTAPVPVGLRLEPLPTKNVPEVLRPDERAAHVLQGEPASTTFPFESHFAQSLAVSVPVELAVFAPEPVKLRGD